MIAEVSLNTAVLCPRETCDGLTPPPLCSDDCQALLSPAYRKALHAVFIWSEDTYKGDCCSRNKQQAFSHRRHSGDPEYAYSKRLIKDKVNGAPGWHSG